MLAHMIEVSEENLHRYGYFQILYSAILKLEHGEEAELNEEPIDFKAIEQISSGEKPKLYVVN
jgi:hypothetical protein